MSFNLLEFFKRLYEGFLTLSRTVLDFFTTKLSDFIDPSILPDAIESITIIEVMLGASITTILVIGIVKFLT